MERLDNALQSSFAGSNNRFEDNKKQLISVEKQRCSNYLFAVTGTDSGRYCYHSVFIDCDKKQKFLEDVRIGHLDAKDYGKILDSDWGHVPDEHLNNIREKFREDLENQLLVFKSQVNEEIYYFLCDADKKSEIAASRTADEVRRCGRILYQSKDEDPPEALWDVIEKGYFGSKREIPLDYTRKGIEAARRGDIQKVRDFLKEVGCVDWTDGDGWTMLHHAAHCGNLDMIRTLKNMNANTQIRDKICGRKPIHIAARECHARAVELFLINSDSVDDTDKSGWTPLHYAAWKGDSNAVKYLISKKANTEIMERCFGKKPIHVAVTKSHMDIVQIFLDKGANIDDADAEGRTLLYYAAYAGCLEAVKFLIDRDANIDIAKKLDNVKPIHAAVLCDHAEVAELLLSHGSDIESRNYMEYTPLHYAASGGVINVVQMLVNKGANLSARSDKGETPLDIALTFQRLEKASYLAERMCEMFEEKAKYCDSLKIYEKLFKIQKEKLGQDHHNTLKTQSNIALLLYEMCKYEETLETLNVILNKRQDISGPYHFETLCTKFEKGRVYVAQWKLDEAMEIFKEVYKSWQDTLGSGHHRTLGVAREIAFVHFKKCEFDEALKLFEDIYEKRKLSSGMNDPVTLQALQDVAIVLVNKGENKNALLILKHVFTKRKECLGDYHPDTISAGYHIATVQKRLENTTEEGRCCLL